MKQAAPFLFPEGAQLGQDNLILHASAKRHVVNQFRGPFSVKTVLRGRVSWTVDGRELVVDPASFLILASGDVYSMNIDEVEPVETCCAFFAGMFVEEIALDQTTPLQHALDVPDRRMAAPPPYLCSRHVQESQGISKLTQQLARICEGDLYPGQAEEQFLRLGVQVVDCYEQVRQQAARIPAAKRSTREELHRRLLMGRDYLHAHADGPVSLTAAGRAAALSPFHFHRGFRQAFGETPHSYLTGLRLMRAQALLERGATVLDACVAVGYSSASAFSRLYAKRMGVAPSDVRTRKFT